MNVTAVMEQLATALAAIDGLRSSGYPVPAGEINPPQVYVDFPQVDYNQTYQAGLSQLTVPVVLLVAATVTRASSEKLTRYLANTGPDSIRAALDEHDYDPAVIDSVEVLSFTPFGFEERADAGYLGGTFTV